MSATRHFTKAELLALKKRLDLGELLDLTTVRKLVDSYISDIVEAEHDAEVQATVALLTMTPVLK